MKLILNLLAICFSISICNAQPFYVAPNGNDNNAGTLAQPFATIKKARDYVRELKKKTGIPAGGITVYIRGGNYQTLESLEFTLEDSGENGSPIVYKAYENEIPRFVNSRFISPKDWKPLDAEAKKRVHPKIDASKLVALDVAALGFVNCKQFAPKNSFTTDWYILDLFVNSKRQPLSQFPNKGENIRGVNDPGWTTCNGSKDQQSFYFGDKGSPQDKDGTNEVDLDGTNRSKRWKNALDSGHEIWIKGTWRTPWEPVNLKVSEINLDDNSIRFFDQPGGGMGSKYSPTVSEKPTWRAGSGKELWYVMNLLEEVDKPGEWALDIKDQKIYYYPSTDLSKVNVFIADANVPIIKLNEASNVQIIGLTLEGSLGDGVEIKNSNQILVANCNILNAGNFGVVIEGGSNNTLQANNIYETAGGGVDLKNIGNRATLKSGKTTVINNHIHHVGILAFREAIHIENAVGISVTHNLLHDIPKGAIMTMNMNNCLIEYNEIHNIALKEGDTGVFYNYGGWSTYGNTFRYNFSHHTNRANGFYSDDGDSGDFYYKNIAHGCQNGVQFGGGHDNIAENNLFVESKAQSIDDRGKNRNYRLGTKYETNLTQFKLEETPWKEYGIKLKDAYMLTTNLWSDILKPEWMPELPNGSRMKENVAVASGAFKKNTGNVDVANNTSIKTIQEAGFYDYANMDLRSNNPLILEKFPELNEVFVQIGLQKDIYRSKIPTRAETGGLVNRTNGEVDTEDKMIDGVKPKK